MLIIAAAIVVVLISSFAYGLAEARGWYAEVLDSHSSLLDDERSAMTMDGQGQIHIVFQGKAYDPEEDRYVSAILHAVGSGSSWSTDRALWTGADLVDLDIRITPDNAVHIVWCHRYHYYYLDDVYVPGGMALWHAVDTEEGWELTRTSVSYGYHAKVAVDEEGVAHGLCIVRELIEYYLPDAIKISEWVYDLQEWTTRDASWNLTRHHPNPTIGQWTSVYALEAGGNGDVRALLRLTNDTDSLVRAIITDEGLDWNFSNMPISGLPSHVSSKIDAQGRLHAVFVGREYPRSVDYMLDDDIADVPIIRHLGYHGEGGIHIEAPASIFLDSDGSPHVAYLRDDTAVPPTALMIAHVVDGDWKNEEIQSENLPSPRGGISIVVDGSGDTHLAHYGYYSSGSTMSASFVCATSNDYEVLKQALVESAIFTGVATLIACPIVLATYYSYRRYRTRSATRARQEGLGLYELPTLFRRRSRD